MSRQAGRALAPGPFAQLLPDAVVRRVAVAVPTATAADLHTLRTRRVLFGHHSVGRNILDALPAVAEEVSARPLPVSPYSVADAPQVGISEFTIGRNGDPLGKIAAFDDVVRGETSPFDIATFKLCFADFDDAGVDVLGTFDAYRDTLAGLERDLPATTFVAMTVPVVTDRTAADRLRNALGRSPHRLPDANVRRERYNALVRAEYAGTGRLFDIASMMAADVRGTKVIRRHDGGEYAAMDRRLASDPGHLGPMGGSRIGSALVATLAGLPGR